MSKPILGKITHTLFVDDLKGYANTLQKLECILNLLETYMKDAGILWNQKKSKFMEIKRGHFSYCGDITLSSGTVIKCLTGNESYEFMGVPKQMKMDDVKLWEELLKNVKQRSHIIWSSALSDINKCMAINQLVNSAVEYYFWAVKFPIDLIREMDIALRENMNITGSKHTNLMNVINYFPRNEGGRGLRSLEETYKTIKIKLALKLTEKSDHRIAIVKEFHMLTKQTSSFSIFKDAEKYSLEKGFKMQIENEIVSSVDIETGEISSGKSLIKNIKLKTFKINQLQIVNSTWQGINLKQRIQDESIIKDYFTWLQRWRTCPTNVIHEFFLLFYQLLPTQQYKLIRSKEDVDDTRCRICYHGQESVKHLISNCGELAKSLYVTRHDNALKCLIWPLLLQCKLITKCPAWYSCDKVAPYYENKNTRFWWNIPEYTGRDEESLHPPSPDGKLIINSESEQSIYLFEMSVPWTENREEVFIYKSNKYNRIMQSLKLENPSYNVEQVTTIMDVFGGYGQDLNNNIGKLFRRKDDVKTIIMNMQKSIIASAANLSRTFKIRKGNI